MVEHKTMTVAELMQHSFQLITDGVVKVTGDREGSIFEDDVKIGSWRQENEVIFFFRGADG